MTKIPSEPPNDKIILKPLNDQNTPKTSKITTQKNPWNPKITKIHLEPTK